MLVPTGARRRSAQGREEVVLCSGPPSARVAQARPVTVGARGDDGVELTSGLSVGELVVTRHVVGLEDGTALETSGDADAGATP